MILNPRTGHTVLCRRLLALVMVSALTAACVPVSAAEPIGNGVAPTFDEAYYATLDYYGNLTEGSVVKSYTLNGASVLTDYGTYDEVVNLTDGTVPTVQGSTTTFQFSGEAPAHFYFEGKTKQPFEDLPWTLSMHYTLNGVPTRAEDLAGKTGVVEICIDAVPNESASEYARHNYTLAATAIFNQDDILSLEAPGAQVQLVGNLRLVLFLAFPGEEQHFTIRVGADDFSFGGMTFLMVPATLSQLEQIAELSERKDELEDDYHKLSDSLDTLLDAFSGMQGSLYATANGLDQLNQARDTISGGKGQVYSDLDIALGDLSGITKTLEPLEGHLDTASQALTDINEDVNDLCKKAVSLKSELKDLQDVLDDLDDDLDDLQSGKGSVSALRGDLDDLGKALDGLKAVMNGMDSRLTELKNQANRLEGNGHVTIVDGQNISALSAQASNLWYQYETVCRQTEAAGGTAPSEKEFEAYLRQNGPDGAADLWNLYYTGQLQEQLELVNSINDFLDQTARAVSEMKALVNGVADHTSPLLTQLSKVCATLGDSGLSGTLSDLLKNADNAMDHLRDMGGVADRAADQTAELLGLLEKLNTTVNDYIPEAQQALADGKALAKAATDGTRDLHTFLTDLEALMKRGGTQLDAGTQQTLTGLAAALRQAAKSLSTTNDVKSAKNSISSIIEDTWNEHTGEVDNLLLMDAAAETVSLTSPDNPAPQSVQVLIRTQEIKAEESEEPDAAAKNSDKGTFWSRVAQMFKDLWAAITGIFH